MFPGRTLFWKNGFVWTLFLCLFITETESQGLPTSSPITEFLSMPENRTVLEGAPAVLKCKIREVVHTCQWFYLQPGLSFYDDDNTPVLAKEFIPSNKNDCSIKFNKARRIQNGQWLCKGLQVDQRKYIISEPVFLKVLAQEEDAPKITNAVNVLKNENIFKVSEDGHIINTELGADNTLECTVNRPIHHCSWIAPSGKRIYLKEASSHIMRHQIHPELLDGKCPMYITNVSLSDEGNWRCVVNIADEVGERVGPLLHLHLAQFGVHHTGYPNSISNSEMESEDNSLQVILIGVSVLLLLIVIVLVVLICKRGTRLLRKRNEEDIHDPAPVRQTDNPSTPAHKLESCFTPSFIPTIGLGRHHIQQQQSVPNHYTRYLDMTGRSSNREAYMMFPPGTRAPVPSMCPIATDRSSSFSGMSGNISIPESQRTVMSYDNNSFHADPYYNRQGSLYNGSHLYEEIDERSVALAEDGEGYMLPRNSQANIVQFPASPTIEQTSPPPVPAMYVQKDQQRWSGNEVDSTDTADYKVPRESSPAIPPRKETPEINHTINELSNCTPVLV